jgi:hypothetical protein
MSGIATAAAAAAGASLQSSHQGDDNSLEGGAFNQNIQDGFTDLINGALGIRRSNIPKIRSDVLAAQEKERAARQKANARIPRGDVDPGKNQVLEFPLNYFKSLTLAGNSGENYKVFPNSIHFRSIPRRNPHQTAYNKIADEAAASGSISEKDLASMKGFKGDMDTWQNAEYDTYDIFLHLPDKLRDDVKVEYSESSGGAMAQIMAKLFSMGSDDDAVNKMQGKRNFDMEEVLTTFKGMAPGGAIVQKAAGYMTNPMLFQSMKNVNFRSYDYSFTLKPTSPLESQAIIAIVHAFKTTMLPGVAGDNGGIWTLPNEWAINFQGPISNWIDFPLTAVLQSCSVDYSQYLMAGDSTGKGDGAPSSVTLNLQFIETMQLSRQRYHEEVSPFNKKRISRAGEGTQIGKNAYSESQFAKITEKNQEVDTDTNTVKSYIIGQDGQQHANLTPTERAALGIEVIAHSPFGVPIYGPVDINNMEDGPVPGEWY